ncbi:MAG: hypothetical protein GAK43_00996 [Stenotrophomonas maltophilia]|nr:MAG: hypothetical protein GAK43_00996 [Stenotrophomonas maltophilia]
MFTPASHPEPPLRNAEGPAINEYLSLLPTSQHTLRHDEAVLHLHIRAPAEDLFDAADYRLGALIDLLASLHVAEENGPLSQAARSFLLLASDARSLYLAAQARA